MFKNSYGAEVVATGNIEVQGQCLHMLLGHGLQHVGVSFETQHRKALFCAVGGPFKAMR